MYKINATLIIIVILLGCSINPQMQVPNTLRDTGRPTLHAVQNERLNDLMLRMNALVFEQIQTEIEISRDRRRKALRIAEAANKLQQSVDLILAAQPALNLGQHESTVFVALANRLKEQALQLENLARHHQIESLPEAMTQITNTCNACHSLFRKL